MIAKIGLYVCPEKGCPVIGTDNSPCAKCPKHPEKKLKREIYALESNVPRGDSMGDILRGLFGKGGRR